MTSLSKLSTSPQLIDGTTFNKPELSADTLIIGSGAGGGVAASVLARGGKDVLIVEEGGYYTAADFVGKERQALPHLYQEAMQRTTADLGISILQGRSVGGGTTVNWTACFRTPEHVVEHWAAHHGIRGFRYADLTPHFQAVEDRLGITKVDEGAFNTNNRKLWQGCKALGWEVDTIHRNVVGCQQTGACGLGCPTNAKRSMLVTMVPDALEAGARLLYRCRVDRLEVSAGEVKAVHATLMGRGPGEALRPILLRAKRVIVCGGAINGPALLLRSGLDDNQRVGRRTFFHPVVASVGVHDEDVDPFHGIPQSVASHHFAKRPGKIGIFMEAAPSYPAAGATTVPGFGAPHHATMSEYRKTTLHIALTIDGFRDDEPGGTVSVRKSGAPRVDYEISEPLWEALRFGQMRLAEQQLASGAKKVFTLHDPAFVMSSPGDVAGIAGLRWEPCSVPIFTAHQLGGCAAGDDPAKSVVRSDDLRHHQLRNLFVMDGSVFPTSLGVNPQLSIYGLTRLMATRMLSAG